MSEYVGTPEFEDGFTPTLQQYLKEHPAVGPFRVHPSYSKIGDMIKCYFSDDPGYAQQLTPQVTIIRSLKTKEIVGVKILDVKAMVEGAE